AGAGGCVGPDPVARGPVRGVDAVPRGRDDRRVRGDGRDAVLRVLRGDADPDGQPARGVGRAAPGVRVAEVLPVHLPRLGVHAGRADLPVPEGRQLAAGGPVRAATVDARADVAVLRVPDRVRGQGADVPGP